MDAFDREQVGTACCQKASVCVAKAAEVCYTV